MCTPSACRSFTSELPARNQSSSATTERNASRFVVTAGNPRDKSKRIISPNTARVPMPVRSARSSPSLSAFRKMSRYCRTLALDAPVNAATAAEPTDRAALVANHLAAHIFQRSLEAHELILADERDRRRRRIARCGRYAEQVVIDGAVQQHAIAPRAELDVGPSGGVAGDQLVAPGLRHADVLGRRLVHADERLQGPLGDRLMQ